MNDKTKKCSKCNCVKPISEFKKRKNRPNQHSYCKQCANQYNKKYKEAAKQKRAPLVAERLVIMDKKRIERELAKQNHPKKIRESLRDQGLNHCIKCDEVKPLAMFEFDKSKSGYRNQCKDCRKEYVRNAEWSKTSEYKKKISNRASAYQKKRKSIDTVFRLKVRVRKVINHATKRKGYKKNGRSFEILGCSYQEFKAHIESQFKDGMSWERFDEIHIDHIIPMKSAKTEADVLRLNHYTNLQPLWAEDNMKKHATLPTKDVQKRITRSYERAQQIKTKQQSIFDFSSSAPPDPAPHFWGLGFVRAIDVF